MEVAPTGIQGSGQEGSDAVATNEGTVEALPAPSASS